jgi:hypothetical protein
MTRRIGRGLLIVLLGAITLLLPLLVSSHRIDKKHFEMITVGMSLESVGSIFGQPAGTYDWAVRDNRPIRIYSGSQPENYRYWKDRTDDGTPIPGRWHIALYRGSAYELSWTSRHGSCRIWFDKLSRVNAAHWYSSRVELPWQSWWKKCFGE